MLTRDAILAADDLPRELVNVPEWGGSVYVRTLTGGERDQFEAALLGSGRGRKADPAERMRNFRARLAAFVLCDEQGTALFTQADVDALGAKSAAALDRIVEVASRLNHLSKTDEEQLAQTVDLAKN